VARDAHTRRRTLRAGAAASPLRVESGGSSGVFLGGLLVRSWGSLGLGAKQSTGGLGGLWRFGGQAIGGTFAVVFDGDFQSGDGLHAVPWNGGDFGAELVCRSRGDGYWIGWWIGWVQVGRLRFDRRLDGGHCPAWSFGVVSATAG